MAETPDPPGKKRFAWGRVLLIGSLALNLLVVGLVAGALLSGGPPGDRNPALRALGYGPFLQALPRADRAAMAEAFKEKAGSFRENRRELRREFDRFLELLRADPLDADALRAAIDRQRARISERQALGSALLVDRIVAMSAEDRAAYADKLGAAMRRQAPRKTMSDGDR